MIRVSTTTIEEFRRVVTTDYAVEEELIKSIKGQPFEKRWQANAGTAWHRCIEGRGDLLSDGIMASGWYTFSADAVDQAVANAGPGWREKKIVRTVQTSHGPVDLVAKTDQWHGLVVTDHKSKFSSFSVEDYEESMQWRYYLLACQAEIFRYCIYEFYDPSVNKLRAQIGLDQSRHTDQIKCLLDPPEMEENYTGFCELQRFWQFRFFPYHGMEQDCMKWLEHFLGWASAKKLLPYLHASGWRWPGVCRPGSAKQVEEGADAH